ncbi:pseudouridine synthase [Pelovirga terrestris]|uniref:Pseudouridine synthase n=1 Tax=Pelovirga terrestris TaxID=2771352 RepID=A0A8J6UKB3_9BACT|nr:pseudouridine synthase [Pelovirga terrestris]MBD1399182.1 rRNA pseudouridine synthase [Pelovirga terrestris]
MQERLQKLIARAGLASRRQAEEWIRAGRVTINNRVATIGERADLRNDQIRLDGVPLKKEEQKITLLLNKPRGYVCSLSDPQGRALVTELVKDLPERLFPVGRLDYNSEGLLLLTNDGQLSHALTHPAKEVEKTYLVKVRGRLTVAIADQMRNGIELEDGLTQPVKVEHARTSGSNCWFEMTLKEGKNRQVRRMCEYFGLIVVRLKRIKFGFLTLDGVRPGTYRRLQSAEITRLKKIR